MPKESKNTSRRNRRRYSETDNEPAAVSSVRESIKSVSGYNRYSPFPREVPRRDARAEKENMTLSSKENSTVQPTNDGIIRSGIKYIMFPLHLLRFCIFGTNSESVDIERKKETRRSKSTDEKDENEGKGKNRDKRSAIDSERLNSRSSKEEKQTNSKSTSSTALCEKDSKGKNKSDNEESTDEMVTAIEDSDSSVDRWSSASSAMNMSVDYDNIDKSISYAILEEPMDISIEEQIYEKSYLAMRTSGRSRISENVQTNAFENKSSKLNVDEQDSNSSVDEEIARIFQKQCTSSDDEFSSCRSKSSSYCKHEKKNFLCNENNGNRSTSASRSKKEVRDNGRERKKDPSLDIVVNYKKRKIADDENKEEKRRDRGTETKTRKEKYVSRQNTPNKSRTRSSKTPDKSKQSSKKNIKYKETATQTDNVFSDEDVEMIPIEMKLLDKQLCCCKYATQRLYFNLFQNKEMEQKLNYIADNECFNDEDGRIAHKRISSSSASSSSTDLGFDERISTTPPDTDVAIEQWHANTLDTAKPSRTSTRAPPGFPELPQNPPLLSYDNFKHFVITTLSRKNCPNCSIVPPAPSPMRHLYYNYPEFMDLPVTVNSSKILTNILRNNYYR